MNFLYPQFLFGLLAISIPIAIHLFNLQKPRKILFPNVRFLKQVQQNTSNQLKLKHLLILLSRICFIIFLVLTFAQPFLINKDAGRMKGKPFVSVYLDNSFSMQNELSQESTLDISVKSIQQLTSLFPGTTSYGFLTNDFEGKDQYFRNKDKLNERIAEINFSSNYRDATSILKRQHESMLSQGAENKHILWFSDFQKSTLGDLSSLKFDSSIHYHFVPVQNVEISNVSVDSLWLASPLVKAGENNLLEANLLNSGTKEVRELTVKLYIDNIQVSSAVIDIKPGSYTKTSFEFNINGEGQKKASIRFEDHPVVFDNEYFFTLNVSPKINILHLYEGSGVYVSDVYSNETIFDAVNNRSGDFDYSKISTTDLVVLDAVSTISPALLNSLKDFVSKGGSLLIFPAKEIDKKTYEAFALQFQLPVPVSMKKDTTQKNAYEMSSPDFSNPFFSNVFEKKDPKMLMPYAFPVVQWGRRGEPLLRYKNGESFLSVVHSGKGALYLAAAPLDNDYTNLQKHSFFVPMMYKIAFNSIVSSERLSYSFQEPTIAIDLGEEHQAKANAIYSLQGKDFNIIPAQWTSSDLLMLDLPSEQMRAGFYDLILDGKVQKTIALNYGKQESRMDCYTSDELKKMTAQYKNVKIYNTENSDQFTDSFRQDNLGTPLWKYFLIGALLFLLIEILLIRFWK
ncbi:MAG TPA: BatA domain-containing protein [Cytophagaceae bacterium]|nr:BatA domain-containing protein [Cytophagaceae bacterium]